MRVIAGYLGGRTFESPNDDKTHPMSEKMRGAIFNMLGDIEGLTVLDAFAGSWALSFEAISRGAATVTVIDNNKKAYEVIRKNAERLKVENKLTIIKTEASRWVQQNNQKTFDIVLLDPPYSAIDPVLVENLAFHAKIGGLVVISLAADYSLQISKSLFKLLTQKSYGDSQLQIYRRV